VSGPSSPFPVPPPVVPDVQSVVPDVPSVVPDVVVAGGGVMGMSIAWRAATKGMKVVLCDPTPGRGATWAAAGMLAPVTEAHIGEEDLVRLNLASAARWPSFAAALEKAAGTPVGYEQCGTVVVAVDASDLDVIGRILALHRALCLTSSRLSARECRDLLPMLAPGIRGGASAPNDHQVDNRLLATALERAALAAGVTMIRVPVRDITVARHRATGVTLADGTGIDAGAVVVATGCWTELLGGLPSGVLPPVRPVKGHVLRLRAQGSRPILDRNLRGMVHGNSIYLVPRADGTLVVGATVEEKGYDTSIQAGAVYELLRDARSVLPGVAELELVESFAGLRPGSPDNGPFIGWSGLEGLAVATGHYRNGILLAPVTADAVCDVLDGGNLPQEVEPFRADRSTIPAPAAVSSS
jgi:glycine oxidase